MDAAGENPQWPEPFPWVAGTSGDWTSRKLLERTEAMHRGAADRLRGRRHAQTVIVDVTTDPGFAPHRAIAAASGFRAVISTPVIDADGRLIGMVSAHYRQPHYPRARDRQIMQRYGELVGRAMAGHGIAAPDGRAGGRRSAAVKAFGSAARAHHNAAEAHVRSVRTRVGDLAEHRRLAEFHRAAADADRQRAKEIEG